MNHDLIEIRDYQPEDLKALIPILLSTWTYDHKGTKEERKKATELFLLRSLSECDERKVLILNKEVKGLIFARIRKDNAKDREEYRTKSTIYRKNKNINLLCAYNDIIALTNDELIQANPQKGIELNLLIVDPSSRGKQYGRLLVESLIRSHPKKKIYLFSDSDCSYSFYFSLGFSIVAEKEKTYSFFSEDKVFHSFLFVRKKMKTEKSSSIIIRNSGGIIMKNPFQTLKAKTERGGETVRNFFFRHGYWMIAILITALSLYIRYLVILTPTNDMVGYILNGLMKEIDAVGFKKFYTVDSDYSPLFLFILALFSLLPKGELTSINGYTFYANRMIYLKSFYFFAEIFLAFGIFLILAHVTKDKIKATIGYCIVLCLPVEFANSALWGNCDCLYFTCFVYIIYFILKNHSHFAWFFFGLSLSLKMQSIFILPFLVYLIFNGKLKLYPIYMAFVALMLSFLPSYLGGASFVEPFRYFQSQIQEYPQLTLGAGNFWKFFSVMNQDSFSSPLNRASLYIGLLLIGLFTAIIYLRRIDLTQRNIVLVSCFLVGIVPYFLPHMHERYFYSFDVLVLLYAMLFQGKKRFFIVPLMQVSSGIAYYHYLSGFKTYLFDILKEDSVTVASLINLFLLTLIFINLYSLDHVRRNDRENALTKDLLD